MSKKLLVVILIFVLLTSVILVTSFSRVWLKLSGGQSEQSKQIINNPEIFEISSTQVNFVFEKVGNAQPAGGEYTVNLKVASITGTTAIDVTGLQLRLKYPDGLIINSLPANMGKSNVSFDSVKNNVAKKTIDMFFIADGDESTPFPTLTTGETLLSFKVSSAVVANYKVGFDSTFANSVFLSDATTDAIGTLPSDLDINFVDVQNTPPVISGTPATTVNENEDYSFTPIASDAESDPLTFSIANKPSWASFDTTTGKLSGKPSYSDSGDYNGIGIGVSDGKITSLLPAFSIKVNNIDRLPVVSILTPANNDEFTDGSPIPITASVSDADGEVASAVILEVAKSSGEIITQITLNKGVQNAYNGIWQTPVAGQIVFTAGATVNTVVTKSPPINIIVKTQDITGISFDPVGGNYTINEGEKFNFKINTGSIVPDSIQYSLDGSDPLTNGQPYTLGSNVELGVGVTNVKIVVQKAGYSNATLSTTYTITEKLLVGDINEDGQINSSDALLILNAYLSGDNINLQTMDLNLDGKVDFLDVVEVAKLAEIDQ